MLSIFSLEKMHIECAYFLLDHGTILQTELNLASFDKLGVLTDFVNLSILQKNRNADVRKDGLLRTQIFQNETLVYSTRAFDSPGLAHNYALKYKLLSRNRSLWQAWQS